MWKKLLVAFVTGLVIISLASCRPNANGPTGDGGNAGQTDTSQTTSSGSTLPSSNQPSSNQPSGQIQVVSVQEETTPAQDSSESTSTPQITSETIGQLDAQVTEESDVISIEPLTDADVVDNGTTESETLNPSDADLDSNLPTTTDQISEEAIAQIVSQSISQGFHEVVSGDTLFRISILYDTTVDVLVELNELSDPSGLQIGQRIVLPTLPSEVQGSSSP